jgi:TonB-dependent receptor
MSKDRRRSFKKTSVGYEGERTMRTPRLLVACATRRTSHVLALCMGAIIGHTQAQAAQSTPAAGESLEEVIVTGYRQSLKSSTEAKRESVGFVDSIFAEDIGKFPDTNIAESFQRIPGVQISREISGEGQLVAIRGLNTNFTKVLLNNAPVAIASSTQEGASANREVPLDLFPSELFSQLTVAKTASADMLEGGAAGTINMRMARPFDREGPRLTYQVQGMDNNKADGTGARGSLIASNTWGSFGVLVGVAAVHNRVATEGFETVGWASMGLTQAQCGGGTEPCNTTQGNGPGTPATVPGNASTLGAGLTPDAPIDQAFLLANNPGRTLQQIDNAIIPRLGRPMFEVGDKDRYNGVVSLEFRPSDDLHVYLDSMYGKAENDFDRVDMMWGVRAGSQGGRIIPTQLQVDRENCANGCVVTSGVFPNSQFMLEYRPYVEDTDFWGTNPGLNWQITDTLNLDVQGNFTRSEFRRESPTVLVISGAATVNYTNDGGIPQINSITSPNDPANFHWLVSDRGGIDVGRVNVPVEKRETETTGGRFAVTWGGDDLSLRVGAAYDEVSRDIRPLGNDSQWSAAACGGNPSNFSQPPNAQPPCRGHTAAEIAALNAAAVAAGQTPPYPTHLTYTGSAIPDAAVPGYLRPTQYGFVTVDWDAFARDSNFEAIQAASIEAGGLPTTANWGSISEEATAGFAQLNGDADIGGNRLRYNVGVRWVRTDQSVISRLPAPALGNAARPEGSKLPDGANHVELETEYENWLPAANVAWNLTDNAVVRAGLSRTMTRANPTDLLLGLSIRNNDVSQVDLGNPDLKPFLSDNIDLGFEYYTGAEGYFGVAAFRKGIEGFTARVSQNITFGDLAAFGVTLDSLGQNQRDSVNARGGNSAFVELRQTVNASGRLTINGVEFNWVQPLDFLVGRFGLSGLGFTANYTIIDQKGEGAAPAIAIGVPPESYNATLYYENHGVSARLSVSYAEGSQTSQPGSNEQGVLGAALFGDEYTQWDFSSSFDLSEMFGISSWVPQLTVDVININEEERRSYSQFSNATFNLFDSGRTILVGLRGTF